MMTLLDNRVRVFLTLVSCLAGARFTPADVVASGSQPMTVGVKVLELKEARLAYSLSTGRMMDRPIEQIRYLQITGWDDFNEAERTRHEKRLPTAIAAYETLLKKMADDREGQPPGPGTLDRQLLVQCRLLQAYEAVGRFDKAVALYLDLIGSMPAALETLRPARLPVEGSTFLPPAEQAVRAAITRHRGTPIGRSLDAWLAAWPGHRKSTPATRGRTPATHVGPPSSQPLRERLAHVAAMVSKDRWDEALERLAEMQNPSAGALRPELFYWQGRAWAGKAAGQQADAPNQDRRRAGLAFMRVVIHYPEHVLAAESLWRAGELCAQDGRPDLAAALCAELVRTYSTAQPWSQRAADWLATHAPPSPTQPS